jgi:hypothetical protein
MLNSVHSLALCMSALFAAHCVEGITSNSFYFDSNLTVTASFNLSRYAISSGAAWGGVSTSANQVIVVADRHGTPEVAAQFTDSLGLLNMFPTERVIDGEPKDLNFAIFGSLQLNLTTDAFLCDDFRLAQGHYGTTNNVGRLAAVKARK